MNLRFDIKSNVRIPELDGLRGLAILSVVFYHYIASGFAPPGGLLDRFIRNVFPLTWTGVDLFFVLSGFLIGGILMDCRNTENYFRTFYLRRVCRIFPLYFLWLSLFFILPWLFAPRFPPDWYRTVFSEQIPRFPQWGYFFFLQNFYVAQTTLFGPFWMAPTWSLAIEEQFYLLLPLMIWLVPVRKLPGTLIALILLVPALRVYFYLYHPALFTYVLLPCRADTLLLGVLCDCLVRQERSRCWLEKRRGQLHLALVVLLLGAGGLTVLSKQQTNPVFFNSFELATFGYTWLAMLYACLLLGVVIAQKGLIAGVMRLRWLRQLGTIAYGVYITHVSILYLTYGLILGKEPEIKDALDVVVTAVAFLTTLLIAAISWRFLEKPIIGWGHSFSYTKMNIRTAQ